MKKLQIRQPVYKVKLPSGLEVKYTPFLVKHEKALLTASEISNESDNVNNSALVETLKSVLQECLFVNEEKIEVDKLPIFDIEMLFLHLRSRSIGEVVTVNLVCPDDNKTEVQHTIDLEKIKPTYDKNHSKVINVGQYQINMKYPGLSSFVKMNLTNNNNVDYAIELIASCIDTIVDTETEEVYNASDYSIEELIEFVESLPRTEFQKINNFFQTMPKISYTAKIKNPKTGVISEVVLEGLNSFLK